ncbi:transcriptional regulator with XRE-family HTH domain [Kitasatospora sp. MAA4]|uniref:helix-turn-helix domain-containing protein n=1 Tax=Kitasatospora sp. MAA4 TaxID=3035093 RepID=UPI002476FBF6|nr:helix-turn-helix transcriptional regulator [Kitasatospora sp. MAA4]MDH6133026.1 transcriptional regulator with XRE-family HTH domain [Kitasatospora sp. MAA4]
MPYWTALPDGLSPAHRQLLEELRTLKDQHRLTLKQIETLTHYSHASWQRWLNGKRPITTEALQALTTALGVDGNRLQALLDGAGTNPPAVPDNSPAPEAVTPEPAPVSASRWSGRLRGRLLTLVVGALFGVGATAGLLELPSHAALESASTPCPPSSTEDAQPPQPSMPATPMWITPPEDQVPQSPVDAAPSQAGPPAMPSWVGRPASDQQTDVTTAGDTLRIQSPVAGGDALIMTLYLTGTCPGPVTVTDTRNDLFQNVGDVTDSAHERVAVLAAFDIRPLTTADSIALSYPGAGTVHVAVDEFQGVHRVKAGVQHYGDLAANGLTGDFVPTTCEPGDLVIDAVGNRTYAVVRTFETPWQTRQFVPTTPYELSTGWYTPTTSGPCLAEGNVQDDWITALVDFS